MQTLTVRTDLGRKQRKYIRGGVTTGDENAPLMSILDQENVNEVAIDERNSLVPKSGKTIKKNKLDLFLFICVFN